MNGELLDVICCPETKQDLSLLDREQVKIINKMIKGGTLKSREGIRIKETIDEGLLRADKKYIYPVRKSIPVLLINEAFEAKGII